MFKKAAIFGVGLIGGSLGLAVRKAGLAGEIVGVGRSAASLEQARLVGAVDSFTTSPGEGFHGAQLIVLCAPVATVVSLLETGLPWLDAPALVTDACSTKEAVVRAAERNLPGHLAFVGAHPIAGSEKSGPLAADARLFQGKTTVITPTERTDQAALELAERFWRALGSRLVRLTPARHDEVLALASHLPHLAAVMLSQLAGANNDPARNRCLGGGFRDTTRIARGDSALWRDIFLTNADNLRECLSRMERLSAVWRELLEALDGPGIEARLREAVDFQMRLDAPEAEREEKNGGRQQGDRGARR